MTQYIFEFPPRTHRDDPGSSHDAEAKTRKTWGAKHDDLLAELRRRPGLTADDLTGFVYQSYWPLERHPRLCEVRKRLSDLSTCHPPRVRRECSKGERESRWYLSK